MNAMGLDGFEASAVAKGGLDLKSKMNELNSSFRTGLNEVKGGFGEFERGFEGTITETISTNEMGNAVKEYYNNGILIKTVESVGDGITKSIRYDDNRTAYMTEIIDSVSGKTKLEVKPNIEIVKENFRATTDDLGRTISSKIEDVQIKEGPRETLSESLKDDSYRPRDERGHIIADGLGGPATKENVVPQDYKVNRSSFKEVENTVRKLKQEGHKVDYEVKTNYKGSDTRPSSFEPKIMVDDVEYELKPELRKIYNTESSSAVENVVTDLAERYGMEHEAGMEAAAIAATVTCAISTVDNVSSCISGEISAEQAAMSIAKDTAVAGGLGYATGFVTQGISSAMSASSNSLISSLGNSCVPAAAVSFGIASYDSVMDYATGEIGIDELSYDLGENAAGIAGSMAGAALAGAAVGSVVPGAGTVVGAGIGAGASLVGGMVGYAVASGAYETAVEMAGDAIEEHSEELKQLSDKAESVAQSTLKIAEEFGSNAVSDVKNAIKDFNIKNALPFKV